MKILRICGSYYPAIRMGGAVTSDYAVDTELVRCGNVVEVITTSAGLDKGYEQRSCSSGINIRRHSYWGGDNFSVSVRMMLDIINSLISLRGNKEAIVWFSGIWNFPNLFGPVFCRLFSVPYFITPHGTLYPELVEVRRKCLKSLLLRLLVIRNLKKASFVHFTVFAEKAAAESLVGVLSNAEVIPLGVLDSKEINLSGSKNEIFKKKILPENKEKMILFVGRINWKKGIPLLIESYATMDPSIRESTSILLVGPIEDKSYALELKSFSEKFGLVWGVDIIMHGPLYGELLTEAYLSADLYALTSYSENFGMTVAEAAMLKAPILLTKEVGISEFFKAGESAEIVDINVKNISQAVERILSNSDYSSKLGDQAFEVSRKFSVRSYCDSILKRCGYS